VNTKLLPPVSALPLAAATLLSWVDEVLMDEHFPTTAVAERTDTQQVVLVLGRVYLDATPAQRVALLQHEAGHLLHGHLKRMRALAGEVPGPDGQMVPNSAALELANIAADACIHHTTGTDWTVLPDRVTFERLRLDPRPLEPTYEALKQRQQKAQGAGTLQCSLGHLLPKGLTRGQLVDVIEQALQAAIGTQRASQSVVLTVPPRPKWLKWLDKRLNECGALERVVTGRRHRRYPSLPGQLRRPRTKLLLAVDTSGSMSAILPQLLGAILAYCPDADMVAWATEAVRFPAGLLARHKAIPGGGTEPRCALPLIRPAEHTVWLSDGECEWPALDPRRHTVILIGRGGHGPAGVPTHRAENA